MKLQLPMDKIIGHFYKFLALFIIAFL